MDNDLGRIAGCWSRSRKVAAFSVGGGRPKRPLREKGKRRGSWGGNTEERRRAVKGEGPGEGGWSAERQVCSLESGPWPSCQGRAGMRYLFSRACARPPGQEWPPPSRLSGPVSLSSSHGARRTSCFLLPAAVRFDRSGNTSESRGPPLSFQAGAHPGSRAVI